MPSAPSTITCIARLFEERVYYILKQNLLPADDDTQFVSLSMLKHAYKANCLSTLGHARSSLNCKSDYELFSMFENSLRVRSESNGIEIGINPDFVFEAGDSTPLEIDYGQLTRHPVPEELMFQMKIIVRNVAKSCALPNNLVNIFTKLDLPPAFAENRNKMGISMLTSVQDYLLHTLFTESDYDYLVTAPNSSGASTAGAVAAIIHAWMTKKQQNDAPRSKYGFAPRVVIVAPTAKKSVYLGHLVAAHAVDTGVVVDRWNPDLDLKSNIDRFRKTNPDVFVCYYQPLNMMARTSKIDLRNVQLLIVDEADNMFSDKFGIGHDTAVEMITQFAPTMAIRILSCLYAYDSVKPAMLSALRSRVLEIRSLVHEQRK